MSSICGFTLSNEMLNLPRLIRGREDVKCTRFLYGSVGFVLSCHVSGFTFNIKQSTFVKVYNEFVSILQRRIHFTHRFRDTSRLTDYL